jgi:hypothetical protein
MPMGYAVHVFVQGAPEKKKQKTGVPTYLPFFEIV